MKKSKFKKPDIPQCLLWEYDLETFNFQKSYRIVCERVFERGNVYQWQEIARCYTSEQIIDAINWSAQMDQRDKDFCYLFIKSDFIHAP